MEKKLKGYSESAVAGQVHGQVSHISSKYQLRESLQTRHESPVPRRGREQQDCPWWLDLLRENMKR